MKGCTAIPRGHVDFELNFIEFFLNVQHKKYNTKSDGFFSLYKMLPVEVLARKRNMRLCAQRWRCCGANNFADLSICLIIQFQFPFSWWTI